MANYLYTTTAHGNSPSAFTLASDGLMTSTYYDGSLQSTNAGNEIIAGTANKTGHLGNGNDPASSTLSIFNRCSDTGNNPFAPLGATPSLPYFSLLIGDRDFSVEGISGFNTLLGDGGGAETDWNDTSPTPLTWHTPSLAASTYTLIVPTDNVVYQSSATRRGGVLVWHIPNGSLGVYAQNANLPFFPPETPVSTDTDSEAAVKIWGMGFGLINTQGTNLPDIQ
jgi:hypothetical protein